MALRMAISTNTNFLRQLSSCCLGCWEHAISEVSRMVALHMDPSLFIDYRQDLTSLHYIPGFRTLEIRCGESHFQQLQELELYVLNSEVMRSVKSSSSMKSRGLCQLNSSGGYKQEADPSTWFLPSHLLCTEVLTNTFCLYSRFKSKHALGNLPTITISNTKHIKDSNSSGFEWLVKNFTKIAYEDTTV